MSMVNSSNNIGALFNNVEDITRAINNLNNLVNTMGIVERNGRSVGNGRNGGTIA